MTRMKLMTPDEVRTAIGRYTRAGGRPISTATLDRIVARGELHPVQTIERGWRAFHIEDVDAYIRSVLPPAVLEIVTASPEGESNPRPFHYECNRKAAAYDGRTAA